MDVTINLIDFGFGAVAGISAGFLAGILVAVKYG